MKDVQLTQENIETITQAYDEWALSKSKEKTEKEHQKDIVDHVVEVTDIPRSDIMWMFKIKEEDKLEDKQKEIDDRVTLFETIFK